MPWTKKHDKCVKCGKDEHRHIGRGLCQECYIFDNEQRHRSHISRKHFRLDVPIPSDDLRRHYVDDHMSLSDLARKYNCTRQYVHKLLKHYEIERRSKSLARTLALNQGKVIFERTDEKGNDSKVVLQKNVIDKQFFKTWSPEMAYVLGVIYTDGNLRANRFRSGNQKETITLSRFTVTQKEPELLQKILHLMGSNAKLLLTKQPLYYFHVNDEGIYDDLLKLGLTPNKSLTLKFPPMPDFCLRDFIRGCWDGDGSVYFDKAGAANASFVSGSLKFIEGMIAHLDKLGLPPRNFHLNKNKRAYYFRYTGDKQCARLFHIFYGGVPDTMYLSRKYERFREVVVRHEGTQAVTESVFPINNRSASVEAIPVRVDEDYSISVAVPSHLEIEFNRKNVSGNPIKSHFVFPEPLTRSLLSQMLNISPRQVSQIIQSAPIVNSIQKLSEISDTTSNEFKNTVRTPVAT